MFVIGVIVNGELPEIESSEPDKGVPQGTFSKKHDKEQPTGTAVGVKKVE